MKNVILLVWKNFMAFTNDRSAMILTFIVPAVLILIFGTIFGGGTEKMGKIPVIFVNNDSTEVSEIIEKKLQNTKEISLVKTFFNNSSKTEEYYTEKTAIEHIKQGKISSALIIPENSFSDTSSALNFKFYFDPRNEIEYSILQGTLQKAIMGEIPNLAPVLLKRKVKEIIGTDSTNQYYKSISQITGQYFNVSPDSILDAMTSEDFNFSDTDTSSNANIMDDFLKFETIQLVGENLENPGVTRIVGGFAVMFLLFSLSGIISAFFEEKNSGCIKRLLCSPVKRSHILWGKYFFSLIIGIIQLLVLFLIAWAAFDVDVFSNFFNLLIVIVVSAAAAVAFGMLITAVSKTQDQASGLSTLFILTMSALGGAWFPVTLLPEWLQSLARVTITYWSVEAFLQVLWRNSSFSGIMFNVFILASAAFIANYYSFIRFRKGKVI